MSDPEIAATTDNKVVSTECQMSDGHMITPEISHTADAKPVDGPSIKNNEHLFSKPIEVEIDESTPDTAEEEAAFKILEAIGDEYIYSITETENIDEEGALDEREITPKEEEEMIKLKSKFEQSFIREYREVFSESLSPIKFLKSEPMKILLSDVRKEWNSRLYCYKPQPIPFNIRKKACTLIDKLLSQGIIRKVEADEPSSYCTPCQFVPKKSGKLRFVVDFTALNKYVI